MTHTLEIKAISPVAHNVFSYDLERPDGFTFEPGQATEVSIDKDGWRDEKRPFTFTSLPDDDRLQFTIKSYPERGGVTDLNLLACAKRKRLVGEVRRSHFRKQAAGVRPHHAEDNVAGSHVGDNGIGLVRKLATQPRQIPRLAGSGSDNEVGVFPESGDGEVGFDAAAFVAELRRQAPLNTATLAPDPAVALPARPVDTSVDLALQGPVAPYAWPINGKLYDPPRDGIPLKAGSRVRMRYLNQTSMYHPMHLHGQTFQVVGGPRKDTVLVPPKQAVEVDFDTDNPGRWIVHCHNDYHLNAGMATFIEY